MSLCQPTSHGSRRSQSGMALVAAIFLIVVLAALGAFSVRIGVGQQHTIDLALLGSRALAAANSGIEWGAHRALQSAACANSTLNLNEGALNGFTVTVSCSVTTHMDAGASVRIYTIEALARTGTYGTADYVSRRVRARFTDAS
jgi:MSHA biogenesis protein MshP